MGRASSLAPDLSASNFARQEYSILGERTREVFPGGPEVHDGYIRPHDRPGPGIDIDEELAEKFPFQERAYKRDMVGAAPGWWERGAGVYRTRIGDAGDLSYTASQRSCRAP